MAVVHHPHSRGRWKGRGLRNRQRGSRLFPAFLRYEHPSSWPAEGGLRPGAGLKIVDKGPLFFLQSYRCRTVENCKKGNCLLQDELVDGGDVLQVSRRSEAGEGFKILYKMGLVEIAAVISNSRERLVFSPDKLKAELEAPDLMERDGGKAGVLLDQLVEIAGGDAMPGGNGIYFEL